MIGLLAADVVILRQLKSDSDTQAFCAETAYIDYKRQ